MSAEDHDSEASLIDTTTAYTLLHWSYLLRIWRTSRDGGWRASLQSIPSGERHMFADLESLLAFLVDRSQ